MDKSKINFIKSFLIWFLIFYLGFWALQNFVKKPSPTNSNPNLVSVVPVKKNPVLGNIEQFKIINKTHQILRFKTPCGHPENLQVYRLINGEKHNLSDKFFQKCEKQVSIPGFEIPPQEKHLFSLKTLNHRIFSESGKYMITMKLFSPSGDLTVDSSTFSYTEPGFFRILFRKMISRPLFNLLAFFTKILPNHSFGLSIIILTILIRLLLFFPNQKSMASQRKMQKLQPKIEDLKAKYGKDQQKLGIKMMELYKREKINPMSSCFPMLFQMPFLIGLYWVVKAGLFEYQNYLLYNFNPVDLSRVNTHFLGLDLSVPDPIVLPVLVAGAQFLAIKLSMINTRKKSKKKKKISNGQMEQMQKMMLYVMPIMIGFFTATFPSAIGIYWLTSTIFGIFQQKLVNRQLDSVGVVRRKN